jgi:iron complex transport system ATP-binding protein
MAEPAVLASGVSVVRGGAAVLRDVGAGKSTLLRALCGLLPYTGSVLLEGRQARSLSARERARCMAFVPQASALRSALAVRDVVAQGRYAHRGSFAAEGAHDRRAIERALDVCDVAPFARRAFTTLSAGEQRRVLIARALATEARILCLDEPTASLDVAHVLRLHGLLRELARGGVAVIAALHSLDDALRHTDRALLLSRGRCVHHGPVAEVVADGVVREVYAVTMRERDALGFHLLEPPA